MRIAEFQCHSEKQHRAITTQKRIILCATGIQWGKTQIGAILMKIWMHTFTDPDDNFLITAPTYKVMRQSTLPHFLRLMEGLGTYNVQDATFRIHGGGTCYMRTGHEPDSIVGIPRVRGAWGDEAGKYTLYFWENIQGRAASKFCPIVLTTSPYALNWMYKELIKPTLRGARDDVELIQAASIENPYFSSEAYYDRQKTMDPRRFKQMYGGSWERAAGLVYDCFDEDENLCDAFAMPVGTVVVGGIDWGFTHPFALLIHGITPENKRYQMSEFRAPGKTDADICELCVAKARQTGMSRVFCGPDKPESILALNRAFAREKVKCVALPAENDVKFGVDKTYEMIRSRRLKFFRGACKYTLDEMDSYHWPEPDDLQPDQDDKEHNPVKQGDDVLDALRYLCASTHLGIKSLPAVDPGAETRLTEEQRIERLKRRKRDNLETWS